MNAITDKKSETYGNGARSVMKNYNVSNMNVAGAMANNLLRNDNVSKAIERKILRKEDIQENLAKIQSKINAIIENDVSVENVPLLKENREYLMSTAKINGDLVERSLNMTVNIDLDSQEINDRLTELFT